MNPVNDKWIEYEKYMPHVWSLWTVFNPDVVEGRGDLVGLLAVLSSGQDVFLDTQWIFEVGRERLYREHEGGEQRHPGVIDLDILDGHVKNLWADDDCKGLVAAGGAEAEPPQVYCLLVGRKLPRKEVLCLVLTRVPEDLESTAAHQDRRPQEDGHLYRRIAMLEIFGAPPSPMFWDCSGSARRPW
jgi:hypothetical protein